MMQPENTSPTSYGGAGYSSYDADRLEQAKKQVEGVTEIMGQNVKKIMDRGEKLDDLDQRAQNLTANASEFQRTSRTLKRKMWYKNLKMMLLLALIVIIVIIIIIIAAVGVPSGGSSGTTTTTTTTPASTLADSESVKRAITEAGTQILKNVTDSP